MHSWWQPFWICEMISVAVWCNSCFIASRLQLVIHACQSSMQVNLSYKGTVLNSQVKPSPHWSGKFQTLDYQGPHAALICICFISGAGWCASPPAICRLWKMYVQVSHSAFNQLCFWLWAYESLHIWTIISIVSITG